MNGTRAGGESLQHMTGTDRFRFQEEGGVGFIPESVVGRTLGACVYPSSGGSWVTFSWMMPPLLAGVPRTHEQEGVESPCLFEADLACPLLQSETRTSAQQQGTRNCT